MFKQGPEVKKQFEIRRNEDGTLDEVVSESVKTFHLEQMDRDCWWLRIDLEDGSGVVVNFWVKGKQGKLTAEAEVEPAR